jgi:PTH1 family peptidyl-tRNA hydrolase
VILDRLGALLGRLIGRNFDEDTMTPVTDVWLVVGLGNPGPAYAGHRHNIGYLVNDELARRLGGTFKSHKTGRADVVEGRLGIGGPRLVLGRPRTYMNETGGPTKALATFYKVKPDHLVVIHDELDIPFDTMRVKIGGGDNGHNGLKSIRGSLDFVLTNYTAAERKVLPFQVDTAADAVEALITDGLEKTQSRFNS